MFLMTPEAGVILVMLISITVYILHFYFEGL
jgi:hypothetical protein